MTYYFHTANVYVCGRDTAVFTTTARKVRVSDGPTDKC